MPTNPLGQPIGEPVPGWTARPRPPATPMVGRRCTVRPLDPAADARALFEANRLDATGANWTYLGYGPFERFEDYAQWAEASAKSLDPMFHTILDGADRAVGIATYMRLDPPAGVIEVGHINMSPALQRSTASTEAMYLMMRRVFDELGYRRYEWKCDALNAPSRRTAERLGFVFEGIFRQATIYKGRNRDTAWFAVIDKDWPKVRAGFERWLDPSNFDAAGRQKLSLAQCRAMA
ncbi:MAG: GNAT family N-acetyltransferase [Alphaproteobacteria bacterium]|nr:GNAT family N-acetyltransferase [Alphaproteobacteria bacterium]